MKQQASLFTTTKCATSLLHTVRRNNWLQSDNLQKSMAVKQQICFGDLQTSLERFRSQLYSTTL